MCEKSEQICEGQGWEVITCDDGRLIVATPGDIVCHQDPNHATGDNTDARRFKVIAAAPDLLDMLKAIKRHGDLTNIDVGDPFTNYGGKKRPTMDVFYFPRHMLTDIDAVIAKAEGRS